MNGDTGRILKLLVLDTLKVLGIKDVRLRNNIHNMLKREAGIASKDKKISESTGNYITALKADSISWKTLFIFLKSLHLGRIEIKIIYHNVNSKNIEVSRNINFNIMGKDDKQ